MLAVTVPKPGVIDLLRYDMGKRIGYSYWNSNRD